MLNRLLRLSSKPRIGKHPKNLLKRWFGVQKVTDPWAELGVSKNATKKDIKRAYIKMVKKFHPDVSKDNGAKFKRVQKSYEILSNPIERAKFESMSSSYGGGSGSSRGGNQWPGSHGGSRHDPRDFWRAGGGAYQGYDQQHNNYSGRRSGGQDYFYYGYDPKTRTRYYYRQSGSSSGSQRRNRTNFYEDFRAGGPFGSYDDPFNFNRYYNQQQQQGSGGGFYDRETFDQHRRRTSNMTEEERQRNRERAKKEQEKMQNFLKFGYFVDNEELNLMYQQQKREQQRQANSQKYKNDSQYSTFYDAKRQKQDRDFEFQSSIVRRLFIFIFGAWLFLGIFGRGEPDPHEVQLIKNQAQHDALKKKFEDWIKEEKRKDQNAIVNIKDTKTGKVHQMPRWQFIKTREIEMSQRLSAIMRRAL